MKTNLSLTYKVVLTKTRIVSKEDGSYSMNAPMIGFDGPEFLTEKLAKDYISLRMKEEMKSRAQYRGASVERCSDRMFKMSFEVVTVLFAYSVVSVMVGIPAEE